MHCPICGHDVVIEPSTSTADATCPYCGHLLWSPMDDALSGSAPVHEMSVTTKKDAIRSLVNRLVEIGHVPQTIASDAVSALLAREELGSTGIGRGVAVPHATLPTLSQPAFIIGHIPKGVDFDSLDGHPVNRVILILSPPHLSQEWASTMEKVSRFVRLRE